MTTRTVILSVVLVMSLIMADTQVDAKACCPSLRARSAFDRCFNGGFASQNECAAVSGCKIYQGMTCPPGYINHYILEKSADAIKEYCNLGCVSSACGALTTLHNSDPNAILNGAVEKCTKACSTFCTNGSMTSVETA